MAEEKRKDSPILRFFDYSTLEGDSRDVSQTISDVANYVDEFFPHGAEKSAGLRKLLEARDCFLRSLS